MMISILQPAFLPWIGYFNIISKSDLVIFLDHVQFDKRSWQQRNCIKTNQGPFFLTVPVKTKNRFNQKINEVLINKEKDYISKHLKTIYHNYCKSKYFEKYYEKIKKIYERKENLLIDLNVNFIKMITNEIIENKMKFKFSSNLNFNTKKSDLILDICKTLKADRYLSPIGSREYLDEEKFKLNKIELIYNNFKHPIYDQINGKFISNLSIIDLLFNSGPNSKLIMKNIETDNG